MAGQVVEAAHRAREVTHEESGGDNPVDLGQDALGDSSYWYDVTPFTRASLFADPDTNGSDITVNAKRTKNAPSETLKAQAAVVDAGEAFLDAENIEGYGFLQVKSSGTDGDTSKFYLLLK